MAKFEGTFLEFEKFIGPTTNKIVTRLGKQLKKNQKSCQNHAIQGESCGIWKRLDAAHFSHKNKDRKSMIEEILKTNFISTHSTEIYTVDLELFLNKFNEVHTPLQDNLIMLCRKHHRQYDIINKDASNTEVLEEEYDDTEIVENESNKDVEIEQHVVLNNLNDKHDKKLVKEAIINYLNIYDVNKENCSFAKFGNKKWQFDIIEKKLDKDYFFIFYDSSDNTFDVGKLSSIQIEAIKLQLKTKKSKTRSTEKSFNVTFDGINYVEVHSNQVFERIYSGSLQLKN